MILTVSPLQAILFVVYLTVLQQLEGNLIYPRVVGSSLGLPGMWVLAAVTVGGGLFGILGMLIGVPLAAAAYRLIKEDVHRREQKENGGQAHQKKRHRSHRKPEKEAVGGKTAEKNRAEADSPKQQQKNTVGTNAPKQQQKNTAAPNGQKKKRPPNK